jgi:YggT family protein
MVWLVIIRCLLSFVRHDPRQPLMRFIHEVTDPVMRPFQKMVPAVGGMDFSPVLLIMALELIRRLIHGLLSGLM